MIDYVGQQLGNYRLLRLLGEGGFAQVYLAEHIHLGTQAAIKVLHTQLTNEDVEQFRMEARNIAHLVHPHIVRVLEFGVEGKTPFLVMDYAANGTLRQRHPRGIPLTLVTIIPYVKQVASALQYAHDQRLIHRDIKPENMLVGQHNNVLLSDFGIALVAQSSRYQSTQEVIGTAAYMSPEQIQGRPRPASDQYSLGIVVYEWLSGTPPFRGSFTELCAQHVFAPPQPLREKVPNLSPAVEYVVLKALAKEHHQRFASVQTFAEALEQASQSIQPTFVPPRPSFQPVSSLPPTQPAFVPQPIAVRPPTYNTTFPITTDVARAPNKAVPIPQQKVVSDTVAIPEEHGVETHGIERLSPATRTHVRIFDNFTMWFSANMVISTVALGTIANVVFGLGFWDSVFAILIFNILGILPVAFFSTLGPKLGLRQMTISRFSFGWIGSGIMAFFNVTTIIGFSAINVILGAQLIAALSGGAVTQPIGVLIIAIPTTVISVYGYRYIHYYQRYAWIPIAIIFAILFIVAAPHFKVLPTPALNIAEIASFITFGGAIYGFATGWSSYAADYNVKQPEDTPSSRIFWLTFLGVFIPCVILEIFGMLLATAFGGAVFGVNDLLAQSARSLGSLGTLLLVLLALSVIANNIPSSYSIGLSVQVFGHWFQSIKRYVWTLIGAIIYVAIALLSTANFNATLNDILLIIAYWLGPWSIILILEHFVFRHGRYNVEDWNTRSRLPIGWAAIVSFLVGLGGVLLGAAQVYYVGPIAKLVSPPYGMDVGFELGIVFAGISYLMLRWIELNTSRRTLPSTSRW